MDDEQILKRIETMVEEERNLREQATNSDLAEDSRARLATLEEGLDQCWDLLRQRRALREFGEDPDRAQVRSPDTVENYEQ
jgi:vacuolar-type H+-ATPase subunit E/Vma4